MSRPTKTYERLVSLAYPKGFQINVDWDSNEFECIPRGLSRGGTFKCDMDSTSADDAEASFKTFYNLSQESKPLVHDQRTRSRKRVGREITSKEKSDGKKKAREERS